MAYGIRKGLEDIAYELKAIKITLNSFWHLQNEKSASPGISPEAYADEYISTEECARRLNVSDQTIRNWIAVGKKSASNGWKEGTHYINISPEPNKKTILRIPWNSLVQSFVKNKKVDFHNLTITPLYRRESLTEQVDKEHAASL
jgi:excisionase family DNA binding protein